MTGSNKIDWVATKTLNRNDFHGSKPFPIEYRSIHPFDYTLSMNWQTGGSWDAKKKKHTPVRGATCVSLDKAMAAAQADADVSKHGGY